MTSIAELGIRVNSAEAAQAANDLDKLAQSGAKAEKSTLGLTQSTEKSEKAVKGMGAGAKGAEKSTEGLTKQTEKLGLSAKQTAAALRGVPAQFTDIAVSLQGGQAPLTVLLQQGGQLKDMFGGIGPAAQALGGYVAGLINPFTLAGAAAVGLAVAYNNGTQEAVAYNKALILTGNAAGTTADALGTMARNIGASVGNTGAAAEVLAQLAGSGKIASDSFEAITIAALSMQEATGKAAAETVAEFVEIGKDPVAAAKRLNDQYNFLTASIYSQIVALKKSGDETGAAKLLADTYADTIQNRSKQVIENLSLWERAWKGVAAETKKTLDAFNDIGRAEESSKRIADLSQQIAAAQSALKGDPDDTDAQKKLANSKLELDFLVKQRDTAAAIAAAQALDGSRQKDAIAAAERIDALTKSAFTNEQLRGAEIKKYKADLDKIREVNPNDTRLNQAAVDKNIANINDKYKDPKVAAVRSDAGAQMLLTLRAQESSLSAQLKSDDKLTEAERKRAEITQQIADLKTRSVLTADQKSLLASEAGIKAQLDKNVAVAEEVRLHNETIKLQERSAQIQASITSASESKNDQRTSQLSFIGLGRQAAERAAEDAATRKEFQRYQDQLNKATPADQLGGSAYNVESGKIRAKLDEALAANQDYYDQLAAKQSDWKNGATASFQDYLESARDVSSQTYDLFSNAFSGMEDAVANFAISGKFAFSDFAKSILADMARIATRQAASGLLSSLAGTAASAYFGGGSGAASSAGSTQAGYSNVDFSGYRAAGGPVAANSLYEVNELGPELYNEGGRSYLMTGANGGSVTPLTSGGGAGIQAMGGGGTTQISVQVNVASDGSTSATSSDPSYQQFGKELGDFVEQKYRQLLRKDLSQGGSITRAIKG
ncbi:phage tail tape measure protein [Pseudomonas sp. GL-RE-29]|uniref:phage tail tape measure protein n=1 Tax=Pseudomonas sp. GL-RE-29 TaxID=2832375 RepID=UPI001CBD552F|nr:phage tail tape measure protein [Pseudomonas sp. GL-RE-29]